MRSSSYKLKQAVLASEQSTCKRRSVGCVLSDKYGRILSTAYNGAPRGQPHCSEETCEGLHSESGSNLGGCSAVHAEQNALLFCKDIMEIETCYVTASPCDHCIKLLLQSSCKEIIFLEEYSHPRPKQVWEAAGRIWTKYRGEEDDKESNEESRWDSEKRTVRQRRDSTARQTRRNYSPEREGNTNAIDSKHLQCNSAELIPITKEAQMNESIRTKDGLPDEREFDKTQLKYSSFKNQMHKDYFGHIVRWSFASRFVNRKSTILDVGCGQELPFMKTLGGASPSTVPSNYVGVDLNKIDKTQARKWATIIDEFNFIEKHEEIYGDFNLIVNFEVFEHMTPEFGAKLLKAIRAKLAQSGKFIFSTPVYCESFKMAKNHINEVTKKEIEEYLHIAGFKIINQFGTFGNYNHLKKVATECELDLYNKHREFLGDDMANFFLAGSHPEGSRNITHVCVRDDSELAEMVLVDSIV